MKVKSIDGFDLLAPLYDPLARLIFGKSIRNSQFCFIATLPANSKVLILGGGTGWLLTELVRQKPDCEVWYVESSSKMIASAQRLISGTNLHFIQGTVEDMPAAAYDVVITNFYLDLFSFSTLQKIIPLIYSASKSSVIWLATDFVDRGKTWQHVLLGVMYLFFRVVCRIESTQLANWQGALSDGGFQKDKSKSFYRGFIESTVWSQKTR